MDRHLPKLFGGQLSGNDSHELLLELSNNADEHSLHPPIPSGSGHAHTGSKRVLMQPHPQGLEAPPLKRFQTLSCEQLESLSKPSIPQNTKTATKWALDNFYSWMRHRNRTAKTATDKCPESILEDVDPKMLNKWLSAYIAKRRKVNGDPYPPARFLNTNQLAELKHFIVYNIMKFINCRPGFL